MRHKKYAYDFCVGKNMRISSWGREVESFTGQAARLALKKKYYEVFPRLWMNGQDVVQQSLRDNKASVLKGYTVNCFHGQSSLDARIDPLRDRSGNVVGARVTVFNQSACSGAKALEDSRHLISIGKQASIFAHRIRNPLNAIKGAVVYLREKYQKDQTLLEFTDIMEDEIEKLNDSISKFLGASLSDMEPKKTDLNLILKKMEIVTSLQANSNNIESSYEYGEMPPVKIDSFQFEQAILNVINNSLEAMQNGGNLRVRSGAARRLGKQWAVVEISDTGGGIDKHRRSDFPAGLLREGRGFGLFITREVLNAFGGEMEITSRKGSGTTVKMYLPVM